MKGFFDRKTSIDVENSNAVYEVTVEKKIPVTVEGTLLSRTDKFIAVRDEGGRKPIVRVFPVENVVTAAGKQGDRVSILVMENRIVSKYRGTVKYDARGNIILETLEGDEVFLNFDNSGVTIISDLSEFVEQEPLDDNATYIEVEDSESVEVDDVEIEEDAGIEDDETEVEESEVEESENNLALSDDDLLNGL